jgi:hypothetical protein
MSPAAIELSERGSLAPCSVCGAARRYILSQYFPYLDVRCEFELEKVVRLRPDSAEEEGYDPMLFLVRRHDTNDRLVWPFYWVKNRKGKWQVGQFPPLLTLEEARKGLDELVPHASGCH